LTNIILILYGETEKEQYETDVKKQFNDAITE
jgi:hypothetical protein